MESDMSNATKNGKVGGEKDRFLCWVNMAEAVAGLTPEELKKLNDCMGVQGDRVVALGREDQVLNGVYQVLVPMTKRANPIAQLLGVSEKFEYANLSFATVERIPKSSRIAEVFPDVAGVVACFCGGEECTGCSGEVKVKAVMRAGPGRDGPVTAVIQHTAGGRISYVPLSYVATFEEMHREYRKARPVPAEDIALHKSMVKAEDERIKSDPKGWPKDPIDVKSS